MAMFRYEVSMSNVLDGGFGGDRSRLFAVYNSRRDEHIIVAQSEAKARWLARNAFDLVRTHDFVCVELRKDYLVRTHLIPLSEKLQNLLKEGAEGKIRIGWSRDGPLSNAHAYFFAWGWSREVKL